MSTAGLYYLIMAGAILCLVLGVWGVTQFAIGRGDQRTMVERGMLDDAERRANGLMARLDTRLRRTDIGRLVAKRIASSGVKIRVSTFLVLLVVTAILTLIFVSEFLGLIFGIGGVIGIGALFFSYLRRQEERRKDEFIAQLPELARVLSNATSAGLAIRTAVTMASEELGEPARTELKRTSDALAFGQSFDDAMVELQERLPSRELAVLVSTLVVSARSGGSLVTALRTISTTLEERKETHRETKTIMGESIATSWAISGLGIGSLFLINLIQPGSIKTMTSELPGQIVLVVSISLFVGGLLIIRRMTRIDI